MAKPYIDFPVSGDLVRFKAGQRLERKIVGLAATVGVDRVSYIMLGEASYNDTVELTDHTWLSYSPWYGWRYFYPAGPTLGVPVLVTEQGFSQPGYWRNFVEFLASTLGGFPRRVGTLLLCLGLLASCKSSEQPRHLGLFHDQEAPRPDSTYFLLDNPKG